MAAAVAMTEVPTAVAAMWHLYAVSMVTRAFDGTSC